MGAKILVIDDDRDILEIIEGTLRREGFEIHCEDTAEGSMELIERVKPDVVVLDLVFGGDGTRGFQVGRDIKARHPRLPVIVISAINREYALGFAHEDLKADEFLSKPVSLPKLVEVLRKYVAA